MRIVIRLKDGSEEFEADHFHLDDSNATLRVISGGDNIVYSPHYWEAFTVDPHSDDPLALRDR